MGCCSVTARGTKEHGSDGHEEAELLQTDESRKASAVSAPCTPSSNGGPCCISELAQGTITGSGAGKKKERTANDSNNGRQASKRSVKKERSNLIGRYGQLHHSSSTQIRSPGKAAIHTVHTQFVSKPILFWGRTREELNHKILIEPIQGWEGLGIRSYGDVVMSSLAVMQISHTEESTECFMVLFPLHLLILSMDHKERRFIYQGLLPLSGMSIVCEKSNSGYTFEVSGPMIEPRQVSCLSSSERSQWISALQKHIQEANTHYPPVSPTISILSYLIPCDQLWKKRGLIRYLSSCPIQKWEGKAIHHMGHVIFLSAVQTAHTIDGEFEDRIMVLFPEDLVFLSVDANKTSVIHQGTLPLNAIHIEESLTWNGCLEFLITGDLMDPILIGCMTPEDYTKWVFHLQKPHHMHCGVALHPLPSVPAKYRRR